MPKFNRVASTTAARPSGGRRFSLSWVGALPFFAYVGLFLLLPTGIIVAGAFFTKEGSFTFANFADIDKPSIINAFTNSLIVSSVSAFVGAVVRARLRHAVVTGHSNRTLRPPLPPRRGRAAPSRALSA